MELLAETSPDTRAALLGLLYSGIGAAALFASQQLWKWLEWKRSGRQAQEDKVTDHLNKLVARLDVEKADKERENAALAKRINRLSVRTTALLMHVRYLERVLGQKSISFESYQEPPDPEKDSGGTGTGTYKPISAESGPENTIENAPTTRAD